MHGPGSWDRKRLDSDCNSRPARAAGVPCDITKGHSKRRHLLGPSRRREAAQPGVGPPHPSAAPARRSLLQARCGVGDEERD